jgi:hypothetical protein
VQVPRAASSGRFQFPPGTFPLWRPFQVVFAPPDDTGTTTQPLIPEDLTALDAKTLAKTEADLLKRGNRLKDQAASAETVTELREVVDALGKVRTEVTRRADESAQHEAEKQELLSALEPVAPAAETDPDAPEEEPPAEPEPEEKPEAPTVEAIAAAAEPREPIRTRPRAPSVADIPKSAVRPESRPNLARTGSTVTLTAGGDIPGFSAGMPIEEKDIGRAFAEKANALLASGREGSSANVISMRIEYPEDRFLAHRDPAAATEEKINAVTASAARTRGLSVNQGTPKALVAAGGLCAPVAVDYSLMTLGTPRRPVRDALVRYGAERGGIRFITPPHLSDVAPGVSLWTNTTDAAWTTGSATKPYVVVTCGVETVVKVDAIVLGMVVGNFDRMTFPEHFAAWWRLAQVQFARFADGRLLDQIATASTATTAAQDLGAARDILVHLATAGAGYRSRNRMEDDEILQVLLPEWTKDVMRADFTRQDPGDEAVAMADSEITGYFAASNLEPTYYLDTPSTGVNQVFTSQGVGPLEGFPGKLQAFMFAPGSFLHLDGGTLDLGTEIRDWTLDQQNNVAAFMETFEAVAYHGVEALKITLVPCPNGWTSAPQTLPACGGS